MSEDWKLCKKRPITVEYREVKGKEKIKTREGTLYAYQGKDYIIRGVSGEIYPIKKEVFERTYEQPDDALKNLANFTKWTVYATEPLFFKLIIICALLMIAAASAGSNLQEMAVPLVYGIFTWGVLHLAKGMFWVQEQKEDENA